jgi:hypothetical protein
MDVDDGLRLKLFQVKPDLVQPDYKKIVRTGVKHDQAKPTISNIKNARSCISDAEHYEYNNVERRRADRERAEKGTVDREAERVYLKQQLWDARHLMSADRSARELSAKRKFAEKQYKLDCARKRKLVAADGNRVAKRKYGKLLVDWSKYKPVPAAAAAAAEYHPRAYTRALEKLERETQASMDDTALDHRADILRNAPGRIARLDEEMPALLARRLAGRTSRDADDKHTQWCRYLNRALNTGEDLGLNDKETEEARELLVGFMPPKRSSTTKKRSRDESSADDSDSD